MNKVNKNVLFGRLRDKGPLVQSFAEQPRLFIISLEARMLLNVFSSKTVNYCMPVAFESICEYNVEF